MLGDIRFVHVLHPYKLIKDLRSQFESSNVQHILDGDLDDFYFLDVAS